MACNWAPNNLNDVAKVINQYLDNEKIDPLYPDFPTGGLIINKNDIPKIMETGKGSVKIRARYTIEKDKIIFYEIPYGETIEGLIAEVGKACEEKELEGISDIHDESSKKIRIVVTCEHGYDPENVVKKLYAKTNFQTSFSYNQVALIDKTPTELNLKDAIKIYVDHNLECIIKECKFDLEKAKARIEIVEGLLKALEDIDNIINLIKKSDSAAAAKENLIAKYSFTENQAKAILAMRLSSLAKLEKVELEQEYQDLINKIQDLEYILTNKNRQIEVLKQRLHDLVEKYGDVRRTELTQIDIVPEEKIKEEIVPEDVVVIVTHNDDIKRVTKQSFKPQHRKGVGVKTLDGAIKCVLSTNTLESLMVFTSFGKMYRIDVNKIPEGTNVSKGINLKQLLSLGTNEVVQAITTTDTTSAENVVFFTKNGLVKKTRLEEYTSTKKTTGIQAIKLKDGDSLINVSLMNNEDVLIFTRDGNSIHIPTDDIKAIGKLTSGVKGIGLKENDEVAAVVILQKDENKVAIVTSNGKGKIMPVSSFVVQNRGGRGMSCIKLDQGDWIAAAASVKEDSSLLIVGVPNSICIPASEFSEQSKIGSGTKVIERGIVHSMVRL